MYNDFIKKYKKDTKHINFLESREFFALLIEMILRDKQKKLQKNQKNVFISYDLLPLKYLN